MFKLKKNNKEYVCKETQINGNETAFICKLTKENFEDTNLKATFYEDCNYQGASSKLGIGIYNTNQIGIRNDTLSSIRIPNGLKVTVYENTNFKGRKIVLYSDESCLINNNFNDIGSAFIIELVQNDTGLRATFYEDCNYQGASSTLGVGSYNINEIGIRNDSLSSLKIPDGLKVTIYSDNFEGAKLELFSDEPCLINKSFNDMASSFVIELVQKKFEKLNCNNNNTQVGFSCYPTWLVNSEFKPNSISGLQMWLDASDIKSMEINGNVINKWNDKSGLGNDAIGVNGPTLSNNSAVVFNGSKSKQYFTTNYPAGQKSESIFVIYSINNQEQVSLVESSLRDGRQFMNNGVNTQASGPSLASNTTEWLAGGTLKTELRTRYLGECLYGQTGIKLYLNGRESFTNNRVPNFFNGLTVIGGSPGQQNYYLDGTISEIIIYNSFLSDGQRLKVEAYLNEKWKLGI